MLTWHIFAHAGVAHVRACMLTWRMCASVQEVVTKAATDALRSLQQQRLITWEQKAGLWGPTLLGSAVVASGLDIQDALDYKQVCACHCLAPL